MCINNHWLYYLSSSSMTYLVVFIFYTLLPFPTKCDDHVICPPKSVYLESGNDCVFCLEGCGNSSYARQQCSEKNAILVSWIANKRHFNDVCKFARKRIPFNTTFYLGAHRKNNLRSEDFVWELTNTEITLSEVYFGTDKGNDCLELIVLESGCFLNDAPCSKTTWPLCEFPHVNPCMYDNGGCEGSCIPRHKGERTCVCDDPREMSVGNKCEDVKSCPPPAVYHKDQDICLLGTSTKGAYAKQVQQCKVLLPPNNATNTLLRIENRTLRKRYCAAIRKSLVIKTDYFLDGIYFSHNQSISWLGVVPLQDTCTKKLSYYSYLTYCIVFTVDKSNMCCFQPDLCSDTHLESLCNVQPIIIPRPKQNDCSVNMGDCHHYCRITKGSVECLCWEGYKLVNKTECRYKEKCTANLGSPGCPKPEILDVKGIGCNLVIVFNETMPRKTQKENKSQKEKETQPLNNIVIVIITIVMAAACLLLIILSLAGYKLRDTITSSRTDGQETNTYGRAEEIELQE